MHVERAVFPLKNKARAAMAMLAVLAFGLPAGAQSTTPQTPPKWGPHLDVEGKLGTDRNLGEADLFAPLSQDDDTLLFASLRTRFDDYGSREGNFGAGVRQLLDTGWNLGGYGYFDRRRTQYGHHFNQITLGAEALSLDWDARANVYLPVGRRVHQVDRFNTAELSGTTVIFKGGEEHALGGFDGELGWRVPLFDAESDRQLRVYGGGYRFFKNGIDSVQGPRARLDLTIDEIPDLWPGSRLSLGAEWQHDKPRGTQTFVTARLRIPLDLFSGGAAYRSTAPRLTAQERRMTDPIVRDIDIVAQAGAFGASETATKTAGGQTITVLSSASTTGANLPGAVSTAGANSTVILSGTFSTTAMTTLQAGQTLMGGGNLSVRSPSGRTATLTTPRATITGTTVGGIANPLVQLANNSTVDGLILTINNGASNGAHGVYANNVSGATISNSTISATETGGNIASGAYISLSTNITVSGNTLNATSTAGFDVIGVYGNASTMTVSGNTLNPTGGGGGSDRYADLNTVTILSGSTGNVASNGVCTSVGVNTGSVGFTDGSTCP